MTASNTDKPDSSEEMESLREELATLRSDVASIVATLGRISESKLSEATDTVADKLGGKAGLDDISAQLELIRARGEQLGEELSEEVVMHPLASIAIAFGVGYLLSRITK
mgnify:FL=1